MNNPQTLNQAMGSIAENVPQTPTANTTPDNHISRVWDIVEQVRVGMLTTQFSGGLRARPLEARVDRDSGILWFVTDVRGTKDEEIGAFHAVGLTFILENAHAYLSITGRAFVTVDSAKLKQIWRPGDDAWFPGGAEDTNVRVLRVEPLTAQLWDGPAQAARVDFNCVP